MLPAQRQLLKDYAEREGIHVVQEFEDVETAKRAGRTSFSEMVAFLRKNSSGCRTVLTILATRSGGMRLPGS